MKVMRRGSRNNHLQASWRRRNVPIQSSMSFKHLEAYTFKLRIAFATICIAIFIIMWNLRSHVPSHDLQSTTPEFVFPLYHYHKQLSNATNDLEAGQSRATNRRALRQDFRPFFKLRDGYYIKLKLGDPPKTFHFIIDTASKTTWVNCKVSGYESNIPSLGPNGMFEPERNTCLKCIGETKNLCDELQEFKKPCESENDYECILHAEYIDQRTYTGVFITESLTVPLQDKSEINTHSLFGCVTRRMSHSGLLSPRVDGLIGLGPCKHTLVNQWFTKKIITQNVVSFCIKKESQNPLLHKEARIGYMSLGIDYKEELDKSNSSWAKLYTKYRYSCYCTATLLFISYEDEQFKPSYEYEYDSDYGSDNSNFNYESDGSNSDQIIGVPIVVDTGAQETYLDSVLHFQLLVALEKYAYNKGYIKVEDDILRSVEEEQRTCWRPPKKTKRLEKDEVPNSPIRDFSLLKFAFDGVPSALEDNPIHYLIVEPQNYLEWNPNEDKLCVNIHKNNAIRILGAECMRDHLFVLDYDNQRVRWKSDKCTLQ